MSSCLFDDKNELNTNSFVNTDNATVCEEGSSGLSNYLYVFILGQLLHGVGGTILYTLGVVFIDSNVRPRNSPIFQGRSTTLYTVQCDYDKLYDIILDYYSACEMEMSD